MTTEYTETLSVETEEATEPIRTTHLVGITTDSEEMTVEFTETPSVETEEATEPVRTTGLVEVTTESDDMITEYTDTLSVETEEATEPIRTTSLIEVTTESDDMITEYTDTLSVETEEATELVRTTGLVQVTTVSDKMTTEYTETLSVETEEATEPIRTTRLVGITTESKESTTEFTETPGIETEEVTEAVRTTRFEEEVTSQFQSPTEAVTELVRTTSFVEGVTTESEQMTTEFTEPPGVGTVTSQDQVTTEAATESVTTTPFKEEVTSPFQSTTEQVTEKVRTTPFEKEVTSQYSTSEVEVTEAAKSTTVFEEVTTNPIGITTSTTQGDKITPEEIVTTVEVNPSGSTEAPVASTGSLASTVEGEQTTQGESTSTKGTVTTVQINPSSEGPGASTEVVVVTTRIVASTEEGVTATQGEGVTTKETVTTVQVNPSSEGPEGSTNVPLATTRGAVSTAESASTTIFESATTKETGTTRQTNPSTDRPAGSTESPVASTGGVASTVEAAGTTQSEGTTTKGTATTRQTNPATEEPAGSTEAPSSEGPAGSTIVTVASTEGIASTQKPEGTTQGETATTKETVSTRQTNPGTEEPAGSTEAPPSEGPVGSTKVTVVSTEGVASTQEPKGTTQGESVTTKETVSTRQTNPGTEEPAGSTEAPPSDGPVGSTIVTVVSTEGVASTQEPKGTTQGESVTTKKMSTTRQTTSATERPASSTEAPSSERPVGSTKINAASTERVASTQESEGTTQGESVTTKEMAITRQTTSVTERPVGSTEAPVATTRVVATSQEPEGTTQGESVSSKGMVTTSQTKPATDSPAGSTQASSRTTRDQQATTRPPSRTTSESAVTATASPSFTTSEMMNRTNITSPVPVQYNEAVRATATILELNGDEAFLSVPLQDPTNPVFLNFQASLCNALLEYFQDLSIDTEGIQCRVTNLVSGSIIASIEFNVTDVNQEGVLVTAVSIFNAQFMTETFLIDSRSRNVFTFASFLVDGVDVCGLETPCLNGGTCRGSGYNTFTCLCPDGWTGDTCENEFLIVLEVIDTTDTRVDLAWNFLDEDNLVAFVLEYRKSEEDGWTLSTLISKSVREYTISGLDPSTLYFVRLLGFFTEETKVISFQKAFITTEAVIGPETGESVTPQGLSNSVLIWILVVVALVAFVLFIFVVVMVYRRHRDSVTLPFRDFKGRFAVGVRDNVAYDFEIQGGPPSPPSVSAMALGSDRSGPSTAFWEIPRERLVVGNRKQYGRFGEIYFGKVLIGSQSLAIDVKKQRDNTPLDKKKLLAELSVLSHVGRHANVLNLVGACSKTSGPVHLAFESMEPVRLDVFLRTVQDVHKPVTMHVPDFNITTPLMPLLLKFAADIAAGLSHLATKRIVQHSLGVRNIALTVDLVAKVTDFAIKDETQNTGRAVNGDSQSSYPSSARWMAYETLVFSTCTEKSNVWSLGVIIWEIMSFGREPFNGYHVDELSRKLTEGYTLNQPDGCLDDIYEIIQNCLRLEPNERPNLRSLVARLARRYQSIKLQDKETRAEVFQSLAQLKDNHDNMSPPQIRSMEMLVNGNIDKELGQARLMAVQYAATAFPGSHVASKYTLLSACGDEIEVVRTEAINIIKMQARIAEMNMDSDTPSGKMLPAFPLMINQIRTKAFDNLPNSSLKSQGPLGVFTIPFKALVYEKVAVYLRMCLAYSAGVSPNVFKTSEMKKQGPALSRYVNDLLDMYAGDAGAPVSTYTGLLRQYVSAIGGGMGLFSLLEVVAMAPDKLAPQFVKKTDSLKMLLYSDEEAVRLYAAQLLGVVLCYAPPPLVVDTIMSFTSRLDSESIETCQAMLWVLGYTIGRQMQKEIQANKDTFSRLTDTHNLGENIYRRATEAIVAKLESSSPTIVKAACTAIAEIGRNGPISLPKGGKTNGRSTTKGSSESVRSKNGATGPTKLSLVQRLTEIFTRDSVLYVLEVKKEAALALAHLMVGESEFPYSKLVLEALPKGLKISAPSREQLFPFQFHLADVLSTALQGPSAPAALDPWLDETTTPLGRATPTNGSLKALLDTLLTDRRETNNSDEKEAIAVMLTVLFETFRHNQSVKDNEAEIMSIIKDAVMEWDGSGVVSELPRDLQNRILQVLKLARASNDTSSPFASRMDSSDASSSPASRMDSDEPMYATVHRRVTPDVHSSSAEGSEDTMNDDTPMLNGATNEDDELTSF